MSLCKGIEFRYLLTQLTELETNEFINQIINNHKDIIGKALFQFCKESSNDEQVNTVNNLLTKIIRLRKKKSKKKCKITLDTLPKQLIGNIASFLPQYDYINFSKSNRFIFLGCNTPNLLQKLNLLNINNYSRINLKLFSSIKTFRFNINKFYQFDISSINGQTILNGLECIDLFGDDQHNININSFIIQKCINTNSVTTLKLRSFGTPQNPFDYDKLHKILAKFPNIKYFMYMKCFTNIDINKLKITWSKLQGIYIGTLPKITQLLINGFANKLNFLGFIEWSPCNLSNIDFKRLQTLELHNPCHVTLNYMWKSAVNIKQMRIVFSAAGVDNNGFDSNNKQVEESIFKLITNCKQIKYIKLKDNGKFFGSILDGVKQALLKTKEITRETMKIEIEIDSEMEFNLMEFTSNIINIIRLFKMSKIKHFVFILAFLNLDEKFELNKLNNDDNKLVSNVIIKQVGRIETKQIKLIISNIHCNINGYGENWKSMF